MKTRIYLLGFFTLSILMSAQTKGVGIGTTNPIATLDVEGDVKIATIDELSGNINFSDGSSFLFANPDGKIAASKITTKYALNDIELLTGTVDGAEITAYDVSTSSTRNKTIQTATFNLTRSDVKLLDFEVILNPPMCMNPVTSVYNTSCTGETRGLAINLNYRVEIKSPDGTIETKYGSSTNHTFPAYGTTDVSNKMVYAYHKTGTITFYLSTPQVGTYTITTILESTGVVQDLGGGSPLKFHLDKTSTKVGLYTQL